MMSTSFLSLLKEEAAESCVMDTSNDCLPLSCHPQPVNHPPANEIITDSKSQRLSMTNSNPRNVQLSGGIRNEADSSFEPLPRGRCNTWPLLPEGFIETEEPSRVVEPSSGDVPRIQSGSLVDSTSAPPKKNTSRRNPWGNMSYADLIAEAIISSTERRATLSQIYDWMVQNVPYFKDKGDSNSSAGWKNSIRHNLSLHNRFMRMQNEGTGKSSWWVLNPDAKPGKSTRRRANTLEGSRLEKKRGRVRKKVDVLRNGIEPPPSPSLGESMEYFPNSPSAVPLHHPFQLSPQDYHHRPRASSNASSCGRLSPIPAIDADMHDAQVPPISPGVAGWGTDYWSINNHGHHGHHGGHPHEHYADHLVDSIGEGLKLGPRDSWSHHQHHHHHQHLGFQGGPGDCLPMPPHHQHSPHLMNGFLTPHHNPHLHRPNYGASYENYNGYMPSGAHCPPFPPHPKEKHRRPHTGSVPQHINNLQAMPASNNQSSHNISPPRAFGEPHFPSNCDQEMRSTSAFSSPPPPSLPTTTLSQSNNNNSSSNNPSPPSCQFSIKSEDSKKSDLSDAVSTSSASSCSVASSSSSQQEETISESTTMLRVALSHKEASTCLMNGSPYYKHNGYVQHHMMAVSGPHGNTDFVDFDNIQGGLDCNVEEVIKHELQYEDHLNFDLEHSQAGAYNYAHAYAHREPASQIGGPSGPVPVYSCSSIPSGNHWVR